MTIDLQSLTEFWHFIMEKGGWTLVALIGLSILTLATTIVSTIQLVFLKPFSSQRGAAGNLITFIKSLQVKNIPQSHIEEQATVRAKLHLRKAQTGFRLLELIVTAAPLLGLLGTVLGMIEAFQAMQTSGDQVKPSDLAGGIWEALTTTAAGMIVALLALALHSLLDAIADQFRFRLEQVATETLAGTSINADSNNSDDMPLAVIQDLKSTGS